VNWGRLYAVIACLLVAAGLVAAFVTIGSPGHARMLRMDRLRVADLKNIAKALHQGYEQNRDVPKALPRNLPASYYDSSEDAQWVQRRDFTHDPQTHEPYSFDRIDAKKYRLCAVFALASESETDAGKPVLTFWSHGAGRTCYVLDATQR
jgi:hypothetical protein